MSKIPTRISIFMYFLVTMFVALLPVVGEYVRIQRIDDFTKKSIEIESKILSKRKSMRSSGRQNFYLKVKYYNKLSKKKFVKDVLVNNDVYLKYNTGEYIPILLIEKGNKIQEKTTFKRTISPSPYSSTIFIIIICIITIPFGYCSIKLLYGSIFYHKLIKNNKISIITSLINN
jgi:hypothetical protein